VDFECVNALDTNRLEELIVQHKIDCIYHLAAILSAKGEKNPFQSWHVNVNSFQVTVELAIKHKVQRVFWPSSIAVYGEDKNPINAPQQVDMNPLTMYGVSKLACEKLMIYYHQKFNLDIRSLRLPGVLSSDPAGGGTTDYAVEMVQAVKNGKDYTCFLAPQTELPMIYIDDAIRATLSIMEAPKEAIKVRSSYNLSGLSFNPTEIAASIRKKIPDFEIGHVPDFRQKIADSWPQSIDDTAAQNDWAWKNETSLDKMTSIMLENLSS